MNVSLKLLSAVLVLHSVQLVNCWEALQFAFVDDQDLENQGYACNSSAKPFGFMKNGEEIFNITPDSCIKIGCFYGVIIYNGCDVPIAGPGCVLTKQDFTKPYPDCCKKVNCETIVQMLIRMLL